MGKLKQLVEMLRKALKLAFIVITHKDEFRYHFDKIHDLRVQIEAQKDEIIRLYETMKEEYQEE